jgi:hypothetical protein
MAVRGVDVPQKTSVDSAVQATKRGIEAPGPSDAYVFGPVPDRGVGVAPANTETLLPR